MRRLHVSRSITAPPEAVWDLLVDLDHWPEWGPTVRGAHLDDGTRRLSEGATGRVEASLGLRLPFRVEDFEPGRRWSWRVGGVPATDHAVEAAGDGARVTFGVPVPAAPYLAVCAAALVRIDRLVTAPRG